MRDWLSARSRCGRAIPRLPRLRCASDFCRSQRGKVKFFRIGHSLQGFVPLRIRWVDPANECVDRFRFRTSRDPFVRRRAITPPGAIGRAARATGAIKGSEPFTPQTTEPDPLNQTVWVK